MKKKLKSIILLILVVLAAILSPLLKDKDKESDAKINTDNTTSISESTESTDKKNDDIQDTKPGGNLQVHFIDVGQADAILINSDGHFMLVDAGNKADEETVINYLNENGVTDLEYVIGTHPHEDHIGSMASVINNFNIETIMLPDKTTTTKVYQNMLNAISKKGLSITSPSVGTTYTLGSASFTIIAPNKDYGDELNNWSVGIKLTNGNNSFVMYGDAEIDAEHDIVANGIDISADVLKCGHHGSGTSTSEEMLKAVNPKYAVISVGEDNSYGHPALNNLKNLKNLGIEIYRTDEEGTIVATSDGENISFNVKPSTSMRAGDSE